MLEASGQPRLALEARCELRRVTEQLLDRDRSADAEVSRREDLAHAATRDLATGLVVRTLDLGQVRVIAFGVDRRQRTGNIATHLAAREMAREQVAAGGVNRAVGSRGEQRVERL